MLRAQCEEHKDSNVTSLSTICFGLLCDVGDTTSKILALLTKDFLNAWGHLHTKRVWRAWWAAGCQVAENCDSNGHATSLVPKNVNGHFEGYSVMLIGQGWDQNEKLASGYRKKCGMTCLRYCYETRIVRNNGTPAALCLTLVWSRNQIRLGIATLQFCNDRNGAGGTARCHECLSGSSMVSPVIKFWNPHLIPDLIPDLIPLPSCQASPISKQIEPLATRLGCIEMDVTETRSNISKKKIPEAQKVTWSLADDICSWRHQGEVSIKGSLIFWFHHFREWLEQQIGGLKCQTSRMLKTCWICDLQTSSR